MNSDDGGNGNGQPKRLDTIASNSNVEEIAEERAENGEVRPHSNRSGLTQTSSGWSLTSQSSNSGAPGMWGMLTSMFGCWKPRTKDVPKSNMLKDEDDDDRGVKARVVKTFDSELGILSPGDTVLVKGQREEGLFEAQHRGMSLTIPIDTVEILTSPLPKKKKKPRDNLGGVAQTPTRTDSEISIQEEAEENLRGYLNAIRKLSHLSDMKAGQRHSAPHSATKYHKIVNISQPLDILKTSIYLDDEGFKGSVPGIEMDQIKQLGGDIERKELYGNRKFSSNAADSEFEGSCASDSSRTTASFTPRKSGEVFTEINFNRLTLGPRIGVGSYGEVYKAKWRGTDVAVKKLWESELDEKHLLEFRSEISLLQRLRHPNIVLFMGGCTISPPYAIVTEFVPRGSLYRVLHSSQIVIDWKKRLKMAKDVAQGMNFLHTCEPMVVHRDLKSLNLLVDKHWNVKVCDFGLSKTKNATLLSNGSGRGTPEWMAPEVLRSEPYDEKADVYSYGVVLWELLTRSVPYQGMNSMQVVGAVGFQGQRLQIPSSCDIAFATLIKDCWKETPSERPSFEEILFRLEKYAEHLMKKEKVGGSSGGPSSAVAR